jgi:hypothetical protein
MIQESKTVSAFLALQQIFISARWKLGKNINPNLLYDLLDGAEYLAGLASRAEDKTDEFEDYLRMLCERHGCSQALRVYEGMNPRANE